MEEFLLQVKEFASSRITGLIIVAVFLFVMFLIWGKLSSKFIKKFLFGALLGIGVSAFLFFILKMHLDQVGIIGMITFAFGAIFKKVQVP